MGRGRQKAKQTKVARDLKYQTGAIDVTALQRELGGEPVNQPPSADLENEDEDHLSYAYPADDEPGTGRSLRR